MPSRRSARSAARSAGGAPRASSAITGSTARRRRRTSWPRCAGRTRRRSPPRAATTTRSALPLTLTRIEPDTELVVCEMGMRGLGQIAELCAIARPDVGVITSIGPVHLELLGTVENVARAKAEVVGALPAGGTAVVPGRSPAGAVPRPRRHRDSPLRQAERDVVRARSRAAAGSASTSAARRSSSSSRSPRGTRRRTRLAALLAVKAPRPPAAAGASRGRALALARRGVAASGRRPADQRFVQREPDLHARSARAPRGARGPHRRGARRDGRARPDVARVPPGDRRARERPRHRRRARSRGARARLRR